MRSVIAALSLLAASPASAHEVARNNLLIVHPYTMEQAGGSPRDVIVSFTVHNHARKTDRLTGATSPLAERVEIAGAGPEGLEVPGNASVTLSKTGAHVKLHGVSKALTGYDTFPLTLHFERAGKIAVDVMVEEATK